MVFDGPTARPRRRHRTAKEAERRSNGYKQYGVSHLVRVLRIKRLTALGFSLSQIADMRDGPDSVSVNLNEATERSAS